MKENNYICFNRTKEYKNRVESIINNSKKKILDFFEFTDDGRFNFNIYIYDTIEALIKGLKDRGFKKDPDYMCACTKAEDHSLNFYEPIDTSDVDWTKDEYDNVIYHELIHGIQYYIYGKQPEWLTEGIAKYLDGMYKEEIIYSHLEATYSNELEYVFKEKIDIHNPLSMDELVNNFNGSISYYHSYLIVSYLIEIEGKSEFIKKIYNNNYIKELQNRDLINEAINYYKDKVNQLIK